MDKIEKIYRFALFFSEHFGLGNLNGHSPDYIFEKINRNFDIQNTKFPEISENLKMECLAIESYENVWGIFNDDLLMRFVIFLTITHQDCYPKSIITNFEKYICPISDIRLYDFSFTLHFKTKNAIDEVIVKFLTTPYHKAIFRSLQINEMLND